MRTLREADIESMGKELQVLRRIEEKSIVGGAGSADDPYSQEEYESMLESGTWTQGAYVEGMGYVLGTVEVTGSSSSYYYYPGGTGYMGETSGIYADGGGGSYNNNSDESDEG
jgi:hypothetical protein